MHMIMVLLLSLLLYEQQQQQQYNNNHKKNRIFQKNVTSRPHDNDRHDYKMTYKKASSERFSSKDQRMHCLHYE